LFFAPVQNRRQPQSLVFIMIEEYCGSQLSGFSASACGAALPTSC
jgi:hypothetical protein